MSGAGIFMKKTTRTLTNILRQTSPSRVENYLKENAEELFSEEKPFAKYMRTLFHEKGLLQQEVFLRADISEGYGYKLISEEKRTRRRDMILRLCMGGRFTLEETQRALKIYGMSPLYARLSRDAVLITAFGSGIYEIADVNALLAEHGLEELYDQHR